MNDRIFVSGLIVHAIIGVRDHERLTPQPIRIDLELAIDAAAAAEGDDLSATVSYSEVARRIADIAELGRFQLVETLAERVAKALRSEFGARWLRLRIGKPNALPDADLVGVEITRNYQA